MLHLHLSNRIEPLAERLLRELDAPRDDLFRADDIVVPNAGMQRWLVLHTARQHGVCTQLRFHYLAVWLWSRLRDLQGARSPGLALTPAALAWRVWRWLGDRDAVAAHPRLADYLAGRDEVFRLAFAQRCAAALDDVLTYRPDWLRAWGHGDRIPLTHDAADDQAWQAALWRHIARELGLASATDHPLAALATLATPCEATAARLPRTLHIFALPTLAPLHAELLRALARGIDIHIYALNPCREYWLELIPPRQFARLHAAAALAHEVGHPLLAAWGRQTQAHIDTLFERCTEAALDDERYVPPRAPGDSAPSLLVQVQQTGDGAPSLLVQLQQGIFEMSPPAPGTLALAEGDRSLELHRCHSLTRELEVLHDRLLGLFAEDPTLTPADVLVVVPDLAAAAPAVEAVFGTPGPERRIAYRVSGLPPTRDSAAARHLLALLDLVASRAPASMLFALLQEPLVARRFGLADDDLALLHTWLREAGLHHGLDAAQRRAQGLGDDDRFTLAEALRRLVLGHLLPDGEGEPVDALLPVGDIEGSRALKLGALARYAWLLQRFAAATRAPLPAARWATLLDAALDSFLLGEGDEALAIEELRQALAAWAAQLRSAGLDDGEPLGLPLVRHALRATLDEPARGGVPGGSVTVAALTSLRNIPFRVIAALGLDGPAWPARGMNDDFGLLSAAPRRGDRQRRRDDRNTFLDLLLAARSHLHLSCTARSAHDNSPLPPSVLVDELIDTVLDGLCPAAATPEQREQQRRRLCVDHPLQAFAPEAFLASSDVRIRSRDAALARALQQALPDAANVLTAKASLDQADEDDDDVIDGDRDAADMGDDDREHDHVPRQAFFTRALPPPADDARSITLEQLARFLRNPARVLLRERLQLVLPRDADAWADHEPFLLDRNSERRLADRLLPRAISGASADALLALAKAGEAPDGALGEQQLRGSVRRLMAFAARVAAATSAPVLPPLSLQLALDVDGEAWTLAAAYADLRAGGLVRWRFDSASPRDQLDTWLHQLMLGASAAQLPAEAAKLCVHLASDAALRFAPPADAAVHLRALLRLARDGMRQPRPFHLRSAEIYVRSRGKLEAARKVWRGRDGNAGESTEPARALAWRGHPDPLNAAFEADALAVFGPLREHLQVLPPWGAP